MMSIRSLTRRRGLVALSATWVLSFAVPLAAADIEEVADQRPVFQAAPEVAYLGPTHEELVDRQIQLHNWLVNELPGGSFKGGVRVQLTEDEFADLAIQDDTEPGPMRVGLVKEVIPPLEVRNLSQKMLGLRNARMATTSMKATEDGGFVWATTVTSEGAGGLRIHFTNFLLPDDADMYVFSANGEAHGPYQRTGPHDTGEFWSNTVASSTAFVLVRHFGPDGAADLGRMSFTISDVGHIDPRFFQELEGSVAAFCSFNASCVENASCHNVGPAGNARSAVAKMLWVAGCCINICSGGLVADTDTSTQIPYFLTANHCINKSNAAQNLEAYFQYSVNCGQSCPVGTFQAPPSPRTLGSTIMATNRTGDFTLLRLNQNPPSGSVFLGWNSSPIAFTHGAVLHRISHPSGSPQAYSRHEVDTSKPTCQSWPRGERIYSRDVLGATEGGSSGSPVVNSSGQIVGQLSGACGFNVGNVCDANANATVDGAFADYFSQVSQYLDPGTSCVPSPEVCNDGIDNDCDGLVDCADPDCSGDPACGGGGGCNLGQVGDPCTANSDCCSNKCNGPPNNKTCR